jgi:hypothetical protein
LVVIVGMRSLLHLACDSIAVEWSILNKIFQRKNDTEILDRRCEQA